MASFLRSAAGPGITALVGLGFQLTGWEEAWLGYLFFAAAVIWVVVLLILHQRHGVDETRQVTASEPEAKHRAVSMLDELQAIDGVVAAALEDGRWWDTSSEGLHDDAWKAGSHALADRALQVRARVAPAYTAAVQRNREANAANLRRGSAPQLEAAERKRLENLRPILATALNALRGYCQLDESNPKGKTRPLTYGDLASARVPVDQESPPSPPQDPRYEYLRDQPKPSAGAPLAERVSAKRRERKVDELLEREQRDDPAQRVNPLLTELREALHDGERLLNFGVDHDERERWEENAKHLLRKHPEKLKLFLYAPQENVGSLMSTLVDGLTGRWDANRLNRRVIQLRKVIRELEEDG